MSRRSEIDNLQATLQGLVQNSSSKKIDVDDLKHKLAEGIKGKFGKGASLDVSTMSKENNSRKFNRSKSPGTFDDLVPERGSAVKFEQAIQGGEPAWYKALKNKSNR